MPGRTAAWELCAVSKETIRQKVKAQFLATEATEVREKVKGRINRDGGDKRDKILKSLGGTAKA